MSAYGTPGLIELPTAEVLGDGKLAFTTSLIGPEQRNILTFQVLPRVYGSFRYSRIAGFGADGGSTYDRSFDIQFQFADETARQPVFAVGLRDFLGAGFYGGEYLVATKNFGSRLQLTGGIGWGRFAGRDTFSNPLGFLGDRFDIRPGGFSGTGGQIESGNWFRGPAALFGGMKFRLNDQTTLFAEYSTDTYSRETASGAISIDSPLNFGLQYPFKNDVDLKTFVVGWHGNRRAVQLHL